MKMQRLSSWWAAGLALLVAGVGCDDEDVPGQDAAVDAARPPDARPIVDTAVPADRDMAAGTTEVGSPQVDAAGTDGSLDGADADTTSDSAPGVDMDMAAVDAPVVMDAPPVDTMPDTTPDTAPIEPNSCAEVNCPALFAIANQCNPASDSCTYDVTAQGPPRITSYCLAGGIKKISTTTFSGNDYATTMEAKKPDGSACYTLLINGNEEREALTWRDPAGTQLATGTWDADSGQLIFTCGGVSYDVTGLGCPGSDTEPSPSDCTEGTCNP